MTRDPAYDPAAVARVLVSTGERLTVILGQETGLLRAARTADIAALSGEKARLSEIFVAGWHQFRGEPAALGALAPDLRTALCRVGGQLENAATENEAALRVSRRAAELVVAAIARALEAQRPRPTYTVERIAPALLAARAGTGFSRTA